MSGQPRGWTTAWTTSPQRPSEGFAPNWSQERFAGQTIRQTVQLSLGDDLRVRLSNRYGTVPLQIAGIAVAAAGGGDAVIPGTLRELTVDGKPAFAIQAGADLATDAVPFPTGALDPVTITIHLAEPSGPATYHAQALATARPAAGDHHADVDGTAFTKTSQSWCYLNGVEVTGPAGNGIVVIGDSLIDGTGSTADTNHRSPTYSPSGSCRPADPAPCSIRAPAATAPTSTRPGWAITPPPDSSATCWPSPA